MILIVDDKPENIKTFYRLYEQNRELNHIHASLRTEIESRVTTASRWIIPNG